MNKRVMVFLVILATLIGCRRSPTEPPPPQTGQLVVKLDLSCPARDVLILKLDGTPILAEEFQAGDSREFSVANGQHELVAWTVRENIRWFPVPLTVSSDIPNFVLLACVQ